MLRKSVAVFSAIIIIALTFIPVYSAETDACLYSVYTDNMLFKQNEPAVISGTGAEGSVITAELYDSSEQLIAEGSCIIGKDGIFELSFLSPSGSFEEYSIILKQNGKQFSQLSNVVFGELWLASGQSNMQYPLGQAKNYVDKMNSFEKLNRNVRVLTTPTFAELNDTVGEIPFEPQKDIPGAKWITGEDLLIYGTSAVAYFFANKMTEELNIPVGILNISLGGTTIASWISREEIENNPQVKEDFITYGKYVKESDWNKTKRSIYYEMSTNYNLRIEAVKRFRLSGMIWYQGETDISWTGDAYSRAFDLLQHSYTELFSYKNGLLPIVFTQLASYYYSTEGFEVPSRNIDFSRIQQNEPESRALISIYDIPLTYRPEVGVIHPEHKLEVGERMAFSAIGMVHKRYDTYTTATIEKSEIIDDSIIVTLKNVGDGLIKNGEELKGFSICGNDGIYVKADAEIIAKNTVKISADSVKSPCSATYAYSNNNEKSNLYSTVNGKAFLPVSPFLTDINIGKKYWIEKTWADCDDETVWHTVDDKFSSFYPTWKAENANTAFNNSFLTVESSENKFSINPVLKYNDGESDEMFYDSEADYSSYGTISFKIKNNSNNDIILSKIKLQKNDLISFYPVVANTNSSAFTVPADNEWYTVTYDLNKLCLSGNSVFSLSNGVLKNIENIEFNFESVGNNASISIDSIRFSPCKTRNNIGIGNGTKAISDFFNNIMNIIKDCFEKFISLFK